jgi:lipopolysaccharide export system protein LptA
MFPRFLPALLIGAAVLWAPAAASQPSGPANALQGFSQNRDKPVKIDAGALEVRDKSKIAIFSGNVQVVQGDTTLRCNTLQVFYDQESAGNSLTAAKPGPAGQGKIRRLEARGNVVVVQKDQTATGETGVFDMAENTVTLNGNVLISQGSNSLSGEKLVVNLATGVSHIEAGKRSGGRVQGVFLPSSVPQSKDQNKDQPATPKIEPRNSRAMNEGSGDGATQTGRTATPLRKSMHPSGLY